MPSENLGHSVCGTYKIPSDKGLWGTNQLSNSADGSHNGLQTAFFDAASDYIDALVASGQSEASYRTDNGIDAFQTQDSEALAFIFGASLQAMQYSEDDHPYKFLCTGLGLVLANIATVDYGAVNPADYGLRIIKYYAIGTNDLVSALLVPANVETVDGLDHVEYEEPSQGGTTTDESESNRQNNGSSSSSSNVSIPFADYFFTNQFAAFGDQTESNLLRGERALANDEPLWNTVRSAVNSSMRSCMSAPSGKFLAFYPDYWGAYGNTPYLELEDIELKDINVTQSDDTFYTHVYTPGVQVDPASNVQTSNWSQVDYAITTGVVSVEGPVPALMSEASFDETGGSAYAVSTEPSELLKTMVNIPEGEEWMYSPSELYRRYGARPKRGSSLINSAVKAVESVNNSADPTSGVANNPRSNVYIMPFLMALYEFMNNWANQQQVSLSITFMPNLFPGMRIYVKAVDIWLYIKSVSHVMDYTSGFRTEIQGIAPVSETRPGMVRPISSQDVSVPVGTTNGNSRPMTGMRQD